MKLKSATALGALTPMFVAGVALAHHSFSAIFDGSRTVDVEGVVQEFRLVNPHAEMTLEVTDNVGVKRQITVEFDGLTNLTNGKWTPDTIRAGEHVTVHGNPARSGDARRIWFLSLTRGDGTQLIRPFDQKANTIDAQRRQRAQQRDRQNQPQ
jgi:Family of unknown function (DUF6152)